MRKKDTKIAIIITILIMIILGLTIFIILDKTTTKETETTKTTEKTSTTEKTKTDNTTPNETTTKTENTIPTESEVKQLMTTYIKKQYPSAIDYRINSVSFDSNTKELKEMLNLNESDVLVSINFDLIREGNGYTKEQGWMKINQSNCTLTKDSNNSYYVQKCGSGW